MNQATTGSIETHDTLLARIARREWRAMLVVILPALAFFAMFYRWFLIQHSMSMQAVEDWGHAYIVPLVGVFYIWTKRREIVRTDARVYWPGFAVALSCRWNAFPGI